jgi:nucleoside-diphosphate kinase
MIQKTLSIIKPDATKRNLIGQINAVIEANGLKIVAMKMVTLTLDQAQNFYAEHKERPFFNDLVSYMTSGPVVLQVLEGDDAIANYRKIMGATNPANAEEGTLRKLFAINVEENSVHGSDSEQSAAREIDLFFGDSCSA